MFLKIVTIFENFVNFLKSRAHFKICEHFLEFVNIVFIYLNNFKYMNIVETRECFLKFLYIYRISQKINFHEYVWNDLKVF